MHVVFVYILEAHASDKWPMKWKIEWPEPPSLETRIACAKTCDADLGWSPQVQVLVDGMDDNFCYAFGAWPASGFVLSQTSELLFTCQPPQGDIFFEEEVLFNYLRAFKVADESGQN